MIRRRQSCLRTTKAAFRGVLMACILVGFLGAGEAFAQERTCPEVGHKAPPFGFLLSNGRRLSLTSELAKGGPVVVSFWETSCAPCKIELPILQKLADEWGDSVSVVLIHAGEGEPPDGVAKAQAMLDSLNVKLSSMVDSFQMQVRKYCANELPMLFVVAPSGEVVHVQRGADESFEATLRNVMGRLLASAKAAVEPLGCGEGEDSGDGCGEKSLSQTVTE